MYEAPVANVLKGLANAAVSSAATTPSYTRRPGTGERD